MMCFTLLRTWYGRSLGVSGSCHAWLKVYSRVRVEDLGIRVQGLGMRLRGLGMRVRGLGFWVLGFGFSA